MGDESDDPIAEMSEGKFSKAARKRKALIIDPSTVSNEDLNANEPGPSVQKRPRVASPVPVVVDEFETEASREVEASAGLTGGVEAGSRLELKHQVWWLLRPLCRHLMSS